MAKQLLSLSTIAPERPVIAIDGQQYECAVPDDFGVTEYTRFQRLFSQAQQLQQSPEGETEEQAIARAVEAEGVCRKAVRLIMPDMPADMLGKLRLSHLLAILSSYTDFIKAARAANPAPLPSQTGASSSPDSSDSTAVGPATG